MQRFLHGEAAHFDRVWTMSADVLLRGKGEMVVTGEYAGARGRRGVIPHARAGDRIGAHRIAAHKQQLRLLKRGALRPRAFTPRDRFDAVNDREIDRADTDHVHRDPRDAGGWPSRRCRAAFPGPSLGWREPSPVKPVQAGFRTSVS